jgi:hypothetical protein
MVDKKFGSNIHLYLVQIQEFDNFVEEGDRWALIKYKVKLVAYLD